MANEVTVTAADVRLVTTDYKSHKLPTAQAAITAGQAVYINGTNGTNKALATTDVTDASNGCVGVAIKAAAVGEIVEAVQWGKLTGFSSLTPGTLYVLSEDTAGGIKAFADIASGDVTVIIGRAYDATTLLVDIQELMATKA